MSVRCYKLSSVVVEVLRTRRESETFSPTETEGTGNAPHALQSIAVELQQERRTSKGRLAG